MYLDKDAKLNLIRNGSTHIRTTPSDSGEDVETDYKEYMDSVEWVNLKEKSFILWGGKCLVCRSKERVERHHVFYRKNLNRSHESEIIPLCKCCHDAAHEEGSNKNAEPSTPDALEAIVNTLFYSIVRRRNLPTNTIGDVHRRFWAKFTRFKKQLFNKEGPKIIKAKTVYKTRPGFNAKKRRKNRRGKKMKFTPDEIVLRSNAGTKGKRFKVFPQYKTVDYADFVSKQAALS